MNKKKGSRLKIWVGDKLAAFVTGVFGEMICEDMEKINEVLRDESEDMDYFRNAIPDGADEIYCDVTWDDDYPFFYNVRKASNEEIGYAVASIHPDLVGADTVIYRVYLHFGPGDNKAMGVFLSVESAVNSIRHLGTPIVFGHTLDHFWQHWVTW